MYLSSRDISKVAAFTVIPAIAPITITWALVWGARLPQPRCSTKTTFWTVNEWNLYTSCSVTLCLKILFSSRQLTYFWFICWMFMLKRQNQEDIESNSSVLGNALIHSLLWVIWHDWYHPDVCMLDMKLLIAAREVSLALRLETGGNS